MISIGTLALSIWWTWCDAVNQAHEESVVYKKQQDEHLKSEAVRERVRLVNEWYALLCKNIISKTVPNVFWQWTPGHEIGYIDNGFFLNSDDDYFGIWSRLKSDERLRMTQKYAMSVILNKKSVAIISINENWGIIEKRLPCQE